MNRDELDALLGRIDSLIDEGKPVTDESIGTGTYEAPQGISLDWNEPYSTGDTP